MSKKFMKISVSLFAIVMGIIVIAKITFKDMIHVQDYLETDTTEVDINVDSTYEKEGNTVLKVRINNKSKYKYRIDELSIRFIPSNEMSYSSNEGLRIGINSWDGGINEKTINEGIEPFSSAFVEFTIPKGFSLDSRYFETEDIDIEYNGSFTKDIPFTQGAYTTVTNTGGSYRTGKNY